MNDSVKNYILKTRKTWFHLCLHLSLIILHAGNLSTQLYIGNSINFIIVPRIWHNATPAMCEQAWCSVMKSKHIWEMGCVLTEITVRTEEEDRNFTRTHWVAHCKISVNYLQAGREDCGTLAGTNIFHYYYIWALWLKNRKHQESLVNVKILDYLLFTFLATKIQQI